MKKLLVIVLCVAMMLTVLPGVAMAEEEAQTPVPWDGTTVDTAWYTEAPADTKVFTIDTAAELAGLASLVRGGNSFKNKTIELEADIDLNNKHWTPIGYTDSRAFQGEFNGNKHTISNLYINGTTLGKQKAGLFGQIGCGGGDGARHGAYLHDFTIENTIMENLQSTTGVVAGSAFHDNVLENITVDTATLTGSTPSSAVVGGVQSSQFKNILAKNITINANNGGEIGGMFGTNQGAMGNSKVKHHANNYCLPGTIKSDGTDEGDGLLDNQVVINYYENCRGENITINVKKANSYIGGFSSYCLDYAQDTALFNNCDIIGLNINVLSTNGEPMVGGFLGLRSGVANLTYTNIEGKTVTLGGFEDCSVAGTITGLGGTYGGFIAQSGVYVGASKSAVTYRNTASDVAISAVGNATVGGFIGEVNTSKKIPDGGSSPLPQSFSGVQVLGTTKLGDAESVASNLIGYAITNASAAITIADCHAAQPLVGDSEGGGQITVTNTITFDTNGGTATPELTPITANVGDQIAMPAVELEKIGYTFAGWEPQIPETMPATSLTVKALWDPIPYDITFNTNGGSEIAPIIQDYGTTITPPANPTKTGYTFEGWYTDADCTAAYDFTKPVTGPLTLYAKWNAIIYYVPTEPDPEPEQKPDPEVYVPCDGGEDCHSDGFIDLDHDQWYHDAVDYVLQSKLMHGTGEDKFSPEATTTRAMVWAMLARHAGEDTGSDWDADGQNWAVANGVSDGLGGSDNITREQVIAMLWRYAGRPAVSGDLSAFNDADKVSDWAKEAMAWAIAEGIIKGDGTGAINPTGVATRAEVAQIFLNRFGK